MRFQREKSRILIGEKRDFPIASYADDYTFRPRSLSVFIGEIGNLHGTNPQPFHLPGERMAAKKGGKKAAKKGGAKKGGAKKAASSEEACCEEGREEERRQADAECGVHGAEAARCGARRGGRQQSDSAYRDHEEALAYIKKNGLQDAKERRMINADDKLKPVFGGKGKVSMFEMTKLVNKHIK